MSKQVKTLLVWVALIVLFLALFQFFNSGQAVEDGEGGGSGGSGQLLAILLPMLFVVVMFFIFMRQLGGRGMGNVMSLRNTTARLSPSTPRVGFADVAGAERIKEDLAQIVDFLKEPRRWEKAGARLPRGVLLEGPPGCGKTLLSRAVAHEAGVPFFEVSASEFVELFVGVGAARVRDLFEQASKKAPAVIFIDELDAVGRRRSATSAQAFHQEREQTLNQLLVCMDGFRAHQRVVVLAATNRADVLDSALLRPGRFDQRLRVPALDAEARAAALAIHTRGKALHPALKLAEVAEELGGFTGAAIEQLVNDAVLQAIKRSGKGGEVRVSRADFSAALERQQPKDGLDALDAVLVESTSQFAEPPGRAVARLELDSGAKLEGELLWADSAFIKLRRPDSAALLIPKAQVRSLEALDGTDKIQRSDLAPDPWLRLSPDAD